MACYRVNFLYLFLTFRVSILKFLTHFSLYFHAAPFASHVLPLDRLFPNILNNSNYEVQILAIFSQPFFSFFSLLSG